MPFDAPPAEVLALAREVATCAATLGQPADPRRITVIDYSRPSTERRLWVIDLSTGATLFHEYVAHGRNTGEDLAVAFSNRPGSHQSSLGVFRTAETYQGQHGLSLRLDGLEPGVNDRARERAIVVHGADYVSEAFIAAHGRAGRSWGCPALPEDRAPTIIPAIAGGQLLVAWYPDPEWWEASPFLNCQG